MKIADFGISHFSHAQFLAAQGKKGEGLDQHDKILWDESDLVKFAGTPTFLAPEIVYDGSVDLSHTSSASNLQTAESAASDTRRPPITKAIDIWAFGITLYGLLFGKLPFVADEGSTNGEFSIYQKIREDDWDVPETMGQDQVPTGGRYQERPEEGTETDGYWLIDLMQGLLEKDPTKRLTLQEIKVRFLSAECM